MASTNDRQAPIDRYHRIGLSGNPFSVQFSDSRSDRCDEAWFVDRGVPDPPPPGSRVLFQVIGDQGLGKSIHLAHWRQRRPGPIHYIPRSPYRQRWVEPPLGPLVYGDEIDRMPRLRRRQWFRRLAALGATVVVGTHRDLERLGRRHGFEVRTYRLKPLTAEELRSVVDGRLRAAAVGTRPVQVSFGSADLEQIMVESEGNPRAVDGICHQVLAGLAISATSRRMSDS